MRFLKSNEIYKTNFKKKRPLRIKTVDQKTLKEKIIKVHKSTPWNCTTPVRICIKCQKNKIGKLENNYDAKICKDCLTIESLI